MHASCVEDVFFDEGAEDAARIIGACCLEATTRGSPASSSRRRSSSSCSATASTPLADIVPFQT
jgi:hypothetical protein